MTFDVSALRNPDVAVFTVCNIAYLPKALTLAESLEIHHEGRLTVILFDAKRELKPAPDQVDIIWVEDLNFPDWKKLAFIYDIIEFSTSLKAFIAETLLQNHKKVIFLDPDIAVYSSLRQIEAELDDHPVILTPHYLTPQPATKGESDLAMMRFGSFNLGFFAVRKCDEALSFLRWWHQRCIDFCFMESQFGLSTDQKWISIAPCLFDFLMISRNPGYNAAPWNTFERKLSENGAGVYLVNEQFTLTFFHFSNFCHTDPQYLKKRASSEVGAEYKILESLGRDYSKRLMRYEELYGKTVYSFDYMSDGSYVSPTLRRAYASVKDKLPAHEDPFDSSDCVGDFAKKNGLLVRGQCDPYRYAGLRDARSNRAKLSLIYLFMRIVLRMFGPNRFYDLSTLMVYLSIFRKDHKYWRV